MSKIKKLSPTLANQIAAGEVVERPLSVVKELVENSLDAGADEIKVELTNGGITEIVVTDNGAGIEKEDLVHVCEKYSTSKIQNLDDLYHVMSFGFRGEAMAAIASVSELEIISNTGETAHNISVSGGTIGAVQTASFPKGTKIRVTNIFFNTPARKNYLKTERTEYNKIYSYLQEIALIYSEITFSLSHNGKEVFHYPHDTTKSRVYKMFGAELHEQLLAIDFQHIGVRVTGYISDPKISFTNKNRQFCYVNKRPIKSPLIMKAISDAYNRFIPHGNAPAYILNLEIDPTQVDVNVHPRKLEVRFANEKEIFRAFYHAVEEKLTAVSLVSDSKITKSYSHSTIKSDNGSSFSGQSRQYYTGSGTKFVSYSPYKDTSPNPAQKSLEALDFSKQLLTHTSSNDIHETKLGKIIGQVHNAYIIVETTTGLQILDQHALAERVIYEKLVKSSSNATQGLLMSEQLTLTPSEANIITEYAHIFSQIGFDFELLPGNICVINAIPDFIKKENIQKIILGIIADIAENNTIKSKTLEEVKNKIFAYTACRSAIKFGHKLSVFEMNKLLNDAALDYSATCPHGRPVVFDIDLEELKNKYER